MIKTSSLVLDFDLYPRQQVDSHHVGEMIEAEKAGIEFPPVVADVKSKRVTDGFHRVRKQLSVYGDDGEIACVLKRYKNEKEMLLDAMRYNSAHGRNLTAYDKAHCIVLADNFDIGDEEVAAALSITAEKIVEVRSSKHATTGNGKVRAIALKHTIRHMAGKKLTKGQAEANRKLGGMNPLFWVNQLVILLENELIDAENEDLAIGLKKLKGLI
ncbi:MAG: hypothetical protein O7D91_21505 [Planctomycetota bacterium]|nr:hypothetical protein [Planctomycetota bacterium]